MLRKLDFAKDDPLMQQKNSALGEQLAALQRQMIKTEQSVLIILSGWEASGRGAILNDVLQELDPRYYQLSQYEESNGREDSNHPWMWKFFQEFPRRGRMGVFDHSFYVDILRDLDMDDITFEHSVRDICFVEKLLVHDGCMVMKFFIDQDEKTMKKNVEGRRKDPLMGQFLSNYDEAQLANYKAYRQHISKVLDRTTTLDCPWHVVAAEDTKTAAKQILTTMIRALEWHLASTPIDCITPLPPVVSRPLGQVDLTKAVTREAYDATLKDLQKEAGALLYMLYRQGIPSVIVFEGMDAAGKGGCIRRLTKYMDPRSYRVATTAAPIPYELSHHYLWRFYQTLPIPGHLTIYDRSWYGRVLVERIEELASITRWQQAYEEINEMEESLVADGTLLLKFLLVIDKDEQGRRFEERKNTPEKNYKITDEDWRNREKFDDYVLAMDDMIVRTSTVHCPWDIVPSQDKRYARLYVLRRFIEEATKALEKRKDALSDAELALLKEAKKDSKKVVKETESTKSTTKDTSKKADQKEASANAKGKADVAAVAKEAEDADDAKMVDNQGEGAEGTPEKPAKKDTKKDKKPKKASKKGKKSSKKEEKKASKNEK